MSSRSVYYFYIKEYTYNYIHDVDGDRYIGVVKLGLLTDSEADAVFQGALRQFIQEIRSYPYDCDPEYMVSKHEPRFLEIRKCEYEETCNSERTEYVLKSENEVDGSTIAEWKARSECFVRSRYEDALRKLDEKNFDALTPETILVAAVRIARLIQQPVSNGQSANSPKKSVRTKPAVNQTGIDVANAAAFLKQMERIGLPQCGKKGDENWAHVSEVTKRLGTTTGSLSKDRSASKPKSDKDNKKTPTLMGVDNKGRAWRKHGVPTDTFYLRDSVNLPLLTENSEPSKEKS